MLHAYVWKFNMTVTVANFLGSERGLIELPARRAAACAPMKSEWTVSEIAGRLQRLASSLHALSQQSLRAAQAAAAK